MVRGAGGSEGIYFFKRGKRTVTRAGRTTFILLASEMDKLALYVGENGAVDAEVVDLLVARSLEQDVFALIDFAVKQRIR